MIGNIPTGWPNQTSAERRTIAILSKTFHLIQYVQDLKIQVTLTPALTSRYLILGDTDWEMLGSIEPMQVDGPEENENEAGTEETEVCCGGVYVGES